jgi:pentatricopeptide repeat protein
MLALWRRVEELQQTLAMGRTADAVAGAREVAEADPGNPEVQLLLGQALLASGDTDGAIAALERAVAAGGSRGRAGTMLADAFARGGRMEEAETLYRELIRQEPKLSEHPFNLGVLLWSTGRPAEAIAAYETALKLNPQAIHVLVNYAQAVSSAPRGPDDAARAEQALQRAVQLSPDDDRPRLFQVFLYLQLGRRDDALAAAEALAARPTLRGISREEVENARRLARGG